MGYTGKLAKINQLPSIKDQNEGAAAGASKGLRSREEGTALTTPNLTVALAFQHVDLTKRSYAPLLLFLVPGV